MSGVGVALADIQDIVIPAQNNVAIPTTSTLGSITNVFFYPEGAQNPGTTAYQTPATEWWYLYDAFTVVNPPTSYDAQLQIVKGGIPQLFQGNLLSMLFGNQNRLKFSTPIKYAPGERMTFNLITLIAPTAAINANTTLFYLKIKRRPVSIPESALVGTFRV